MNLVYAMFLSFSLFNEPSVNNINCQEIVKELRSITHSYVNSTRLSEKDLIRIVIPEYVSYDPKRDEFEKYIIKFLYSINNDSFKKISFGPFQMQPEFILINSNSRSYPEIIQNIDSLSTINTQYQILLRYVSKNSSCSVKELINLYNSGDVNLELNYKKINFKMTYYEYSNYIIKNCY
jgi:hypothetical protein